MDKKDLGVNRKIRGYILSSIILTTLLIVVLYVWQMDYEYDSIIQRQQKQSWAIITAERNLSQANHAYQRYLTAPSAKSYEGFTNKFKNYLVSLEIIRPQVITNWRKDVLPLQGPYDEIVKKSKEIQRKLNNTNLNQESNITELIERLEPYFLAFTNLTLNADQKASNFTTFRKSRQSLYLALMTMLGCVLGMFLVLRGQNKQVEHITQQFYESQKMEALGQLAGGMAHDFNNTLAAIQGYADFLVEDLNKQKQQQDFAKNIILATQDAKTLVEQILAYSRKSKVVLSTINLSEITDTVSNLTRATLRAGVNVTLKRDLKQEIFVKANSTQLNQVLMNICMNAADAIEHDSGLITIELSSLSSNDINIKSALEYNSGTSIFEKISRNTHALYLSYLQKHDAYTCISITDNGQGISKNNLMSIFQPFFSTKEQLKGTGLGLSAVHGIVAEHHGAVVVETTEGKGTVFHLFFPQLKQENKIEDVQSIACKRVSSIKQVLLVEDDMSVANMTCQILERMGHVVLHCINAFEAQEALTDLNSLPDIVITDYKMPKMTGLELSKIIADKHPNIPVILFTGYSEVALGDLEKEPTIVAVLKKPATQQQFKDAIENALS